MKLFKEKSRTTVPKTIIGQEFNWDNFDLENCPKVIIKGYEFLKVVYCKDCKFHSKNCCFRHCDTGKYDGLFAVNENDYCSKGIKK